MSSPPTGTVTFLFTDIEGSTRMWESNAPLMQAALARHDEILKSTIEGHGGFVFKTVGDAFCAAFSTAPEALEAALEAQRHLRGETWGEPGPLRVRMALHTGVTKERDGDYFGPPVNRVARLLSAGHGGQVLLSLPTYEMVRDQLPAGVSLRDLGEHRLKDLFRPERVFQLMTPELPSEFPPLTTLEARHNNLPVQPNPLIGRARELAEVLGLLRTEGIHLLTLTGPGGTGKTRLGLQAAAEMSEEFEDGVFFVALAPLTNPSLVASTVANSLGVKESGERSIEETLKEYLRTKELLLVVDNFEHILEGAPVVGELFASSPKLKVLVTSRIRLGLYGEYEYAVPPLSVPDTRDLPPDLQSLDRYEAVRLFMERARAAKAGFAITDENAPAVAEICARLDGLPLAIELAAARIKVLPPQAMVKRLDSRLKLLTRGARDLPDRQRTLRDTIEWSYDLLDEGEKTLFARLAVFAGGRTLEAIEAICDPEGELPMDALEGASSLVEKNLLRQEEGPEGEPRFVMLETIQEYARERLEQSGEAEGIRRLHAEYFLALAEEAEPELKGPRQLEWLERLEAEHDNLRVALSWSLEGGDAGLELRLAGSLWWFWLVRGYLGEGLEWLEEALAKEGQAPALARAKALTGAGRLTLERGESARALTLLEEGVALLRGTGSEKGLADALDNLGIAVAQRGDPDRAKALFGESLTLYRIVEDKWGVAETLHNLGNVATFQDEADQDQAESLYQESLRVRREVGDQRGVCMALGNLANLAGERGDFDRARGLFDEALALARELADEPLITFNLQNLGQVALNRDDLEEATLLLREALQLCHKLGDRALIILGMSLFSLVAAARGKPLRAARLLGAAEGIIEASGFHAPGIGISSLSDERRLEEARARSGGEAWRTAWEEGRAMTLDEAIAYALEEDVDG